MLYSLINKRRRKKGFMMGFFCFGLNVVGRDEDERKGKEEEVGI